MFQYHIQTLITIKIKQNRNMRIFQMEKNVLHFVTKRQIWHKYYNKWFQQN